MARELKYLEKCFNFLIKITLFFSEFCYRTCIKLARIAEDIVKLQTKIQHRE